MCDPVSLTIAATAVAVGGQVVSGVAKSQQATYQAQVADQNKQLASNAAADALDRGRIAATNQYRRNAALQGEQQAASAANGIDTSFGSVTEMQGDTAMIGSQDALTVRDNARRESMGYSIQGANYGYQAAASRANATNALIDTAFSAGSTILGGANQVSKIQSGQAGKGGGGGY